MTHAPVGQPTYSERHGHPYGWTAGCAVCRSEAAEQKRRRRAAMRGLSPVPVINAENSRLLSPETAYELREEVKPADCADFRAEVAEAGPCAAAEPAGPGPVERGVLDVLGRLSAAASYEDLVAQARALARTLDDRRLATTHPSANRQLTDVMERLRRSSEPRKGRLARVQAMSTRHDAG